VDEVNVGAPDGGLPLASYDLTSPVKVVALPHHGVNNESVGIRTGVNNESVGIRTGAGNVVSWLQRYEGEFVGTVMQEVR